MSQKVLEDAKRINQITGRPFEDCLAQVRRIELCVAAMKTRVVEFYFVKKDGTTRQAFGTLQEDIIRPHVKSDSNREPNPELVTYFDMSKNQFRSFRKENFKSFVA